MPLIGTFGAASKGGFGRGGKVFTIASGGTETTDGDFKVHTFTSGGTFTVTQAGLGPEADIDYLVLIKLY